MPITMLTRGDFSIMPAMIDSKQARSESDVLSKLLCFSMYESILNIRRDFAELLQTASVRIDGFWDISSIDSNLSENFEYDTNEKLYTPTADISGYLPMKLVSEEINNIASAKRILFICLIQEITTIEPNINFIASISSNNGIEYNELNISSIEVLNNGNILLMADMSILVDNDNVLRLRFDTSDGAGLRLLGYSMFCY